MYGDGRAVNSEILRFAGEPSLAKTTTIHWCRATDDGLKALADLGVRGLLGLYGTEEKPRSSYQSTAEEGDLIRSGGIAVSDGMAYAGIDIVLNRFDPDEIIKKLTALGGRELIKVMIHEQYFHESYKAYQPNFEKKLASTFAGDIFDDVYAFAAAVITLGRITFRIFVCENAAHCSHNGFGNEVFGGNQLDAASLTGKLFAHCFADFLVVFCDELNVLIYHENHPFFVYNH